MGYELPRTERDWRRYQRFPINFDATLIVDRKRSQVVVGDISSAGAMIRAPELPAVGTEAVLEGRTFEVVATVTWRADGACDLDFHRAVDPLEVVRQNMKGLERFRTMRPWSGFAQS